jgi:hypothetical protein
LLHGFGACREYRYAVSSVAADCFSACYLHTRATVTSRRTNMRNGPASPMLASRWAARRCRLSADEQSDGVSGQDLRADSGCHHDLPLHARTHVRAMVAPFLLPLPKAHPASAHKLDPLCNSATVRTSVPLNCSVNRYLECLTNNTLCFRVGRSKVCARSSRATAACVSHGHACTRYYSCRA